MIPTALRTLADALTPPTREAGFDLWSWAGVSNLRELVALVGGIAGLYALVRPKPSKKTLIPAIATT
jgi:hypothetical protein